MRYDHDHPRHYHERGSRGAGGPILGFLAGVLSTLAVVGYVFYGPGGRKRRKQVDRFMLRAKAEILDRMEAAGDVTEEQYGRIVDEVAAKYAAMKDAGAETAERIKERFRRQWEAMRRSAAQARDRANKEIEDETRDEEVF